MADGRLVGRRRARRTGDSYTGAFDYLDPADAPFELDVERDSTDLATDPNTPLSVSPGSGETVDIELVVTDM